MKKQHVWIIEELWTDSDVWLPYCWRSSRSDARKELKRLKEDDLSKYRIVKYIRDTLWLRRM